MNDWNVVDAATGDAVAGPMGKPEALREARALNAAEGAGSYELEPAQALAR